MSTAGFQTSAFNSDLFVNVLTAAQYAAYETSIARQITTVHDVAVGAGKVVQVPIWSAVSAAIITDEDAASLGNTATSNKTITLTEHVVYHRVTDMLRDSTTNVLGALGDQSGRAIAESIDTQVFALFTGFSEGGPGAGNVLLVEHIMKASATLRAAKLTGPFYCVLNPKQAYALKRQLATAGGSSIPALSNVGNDVLRAGYIGTVDGVYVFESGLVAADGNGDAIGAVMSPMAIGHSMRGTVMMETQRQAAARATDLVLTAVAGAGRLVDAYGVKLTSDATFA